METRGCEKKNKKEKFEFDEIEKETPRHGRARQVVIFTLLVYIPKRENILFGEKIGQWQVFPFFFLNVKNFSFFHV